MEKLEKLLYLNKVLLEEMPEYMDQAKKFDNTIENQQRLFRSLMNIREPMPLKKEFLDIQDKYLQNEVVEKGIITVADIFDRWNDDQILLWQGDITRLSVDAIVNAANNALLGCFVPCHACIDNAIHSASGLQLRDECNALMKKQGHTEHTGKAKITNAYNLPCQFVIHTVGPIVHGELTDEHCQLLEDCYKNCLTVAIAKNMGSIAFCCISTGEFHFPNEKAAEIAIKTVKNVLEESNSTIKVVFNVFKEFDYKIYRRLLSNNT